MRKILQPGKWEYEVSKLASSAASNLNSGSIAIVSQPPRGQQHLELSPYPSVVELSLAKSNRLIIYAPLFRGSVPVLNANVKAVVSQEVAGREATVATLTLNDDGKG